MHPYGSSETPFFFVSLGPCRAKIKTLTMIARFQFAVPSHLVCLLAHPGTSSRGGVLKLLLGRFLGAVGFCCQIVPFWYHSGRLGASETKGCFARDLAWSFGGSVVVLGHYVCVTRNSVGCPGVHLGMFFGSLCGHYVCVTPNSVGGRCPACAFWHRRSLRKFKMYAFCSRHRGVRTPRPLRGQCVQVCEMKGEQDAGK